MRSVNEIYMITRRGGRVFARRVARSTTLNIGLSVSLPLLDNCLDSKLKTLMEDIKTSHRSHFVVDKNTKLSCRDDGPSSPATDCGRCVTVDDAILFYWILCGHRLTSHVRCLKHIQQQHGDIFF